MLRYIIKRILYSALIIVGVMIITFMLFKVAAGDPAATVLGKNPMPAELEALRNELGSNKPLFFGKWKKTEAYSSFDFTDRKNPASLKSITGEYSYKNGCLELHNGSLSISRNFKLDNVKLKCEITYRGKFECSGISNSSEDWGTANIWIPETMEDLIISAENKKVLIKKIEIFREQQTALDSQLTASILEMVSIQKDFPFINFFNFGKTLLSREEIKDILWRGMWPSLFLMIPVFFGELAAGIILALLATAFRGKWIDKMVLLASVAGMSISYLVFIIYGQWYLGYYYDIFPVWGYGEIKYLALPVLIGIISGTGGGVRFYRTVFVNELNREYLRTATAKGCSAYTIYYNHLLRNAMIPIITRAAATIPFLFTGSLLLETFFGIPGLGFAGINALMNSDLQMLKALVILSSIIFVAINLLADIAYAWADPRIRLDR